MATFALALKAASKQSNRQGNKKAFQLTIHKACVNAAINDEEPCKNTGV